MGWKGFEMNFGIGKKYLITTDAWFTAPDGEQYRAAFGTVTAVESDEKSLGIKTNRGSTNWYVLIGNMLIAGCQIHYCIQTKKVSFSPAVREIDHNGGISFVQTKHSRIYNADE